MKQVHMFDKCDVPPMVILRRDALMLMVQCAPLVGTNISTYEVKCNKWYYTLQLYQIRARLPAIRRS